MRDLYAGAVDPASLISEPSKPVPPAINPYEHLYHGPVYPTRPLIGNPKPKNVDEKITDDHVSTFDDRYSSSNSDSVSSSDEASVASADKCAAGGDMFACKRV